MKLHTATLHAAAAAVILSAAGCCGNFDSKFDAGTPREKIALTRAPGKVKLDGVLDEKEWAGAVVHRMSPAYSPQNPMYNPPKVLANKSWKGHVVDPFQGGTIRLMYDDENLYVGAELDDVDVMQYGNTDQSHFYTTGDTLEIFLKPENSPNYWECYGTPNGKKTSLFFETRGYPRHPSTDVLMPGFDNAVKVHGTLNSNKDKDKGWTIEIVFSRKELAKAGCEFKPEEPWTILISRYNYTYGSKEGGVQFSTCPEIPVVNYHHLEYYGLLDWK